MNTQLTLQTLPIDCLLQIFTDLTLPECLLLRSFSRQLKLAVDEHLRFVDTLPVVLSSRRSRAEGVREKTHRSLHFTQFGNITLGPSAIPDRCVTLFDDEWLVHQQARHFRRENFVILPNTKATFDSFIEFISKYMPRITKLAVIIDHARTIAKNIQQIVGVYQNQLKVLMLEKTTRSFPRNPRPTIRQGREIYAFYPSASFYNFIAGLEQLEELYFFPKKVSALTESDSGSYGEEFFAEMFHKLRVFHTSARLPNYPAFESTVEDMSCNWVGGNIRRVGDDFLLPAIKEITCHRRTCFFKLYHSRILQRMPNLEVLHHNMEFRIEEETMEMLNVNPKLERFHCSSLASYQTMWKREYPHLDFDYDELRNYLREKRGRNIPALFQSVEVNRTIKHLVIENQPGDGLPVETILNEIRLSLPLFAALETVIIREPFMKLTVDELRAEQ